MGLRGGCFVILYRQVSNKHARVRVDGGGRIMRRPNEIAKIKADNLRQTSASVAAKYLDYFDKKQKSVANKLSSKVDGVKRSLNDYAHTTYANDEGERKSAETAGSKEQRLAKLDDILLQPNSVQLKAKSVHVAANDAQKGKPESVRAQYHKYINCLSMARKWLESHSDSVIFSVFVVVLCISLPPIGVIMIVNFRKKWLQHSIFVVLPPIVLAGLYSIGIAYVACNPYKYFGGQYSEPTIVIEHNRNTTTFDEKQKANGSQDVTVGNDMELGESND